MASQGEEGIAKIWSIAVEVIRGGDGEEEEEEEDEEEERKEEEGYALSYEKEKKTFMHAGFQNLKPFHKKVFNTNYQKTG